MARQHDFSFFCNRDCQFFPCHEKADPENFNCMFCYCPLYALGRDCSDCTLPHSEAGYAYITRNYEKILDHLRKLEEGK